MLRQLLHALFIVALSLTGSAAIEISESMAETEELDEATRSGRRAHPTKMAGAGGAHGGPAWRRAPPPDEVVASRGRAVGRPASGRAAPPTVRRARPPA